MTKRISFVFLAFFFAHPLFAGVSRVAMERFELKKAVDDAPLFGNFYYKKEFVNQNFGDELLGLQRFYEERKQTVEKLQAENVTETKKLKDEHRALMLENINSDEKGSDSKWAMKLYNNVGRQAFLKQNFLDKVAAWDQANWVEVKYRSQKDRLYLTAITIHQEPLAPKIVATIR